MFNLAEKWGLLPDGQNPCRHIERFREARRERFLTTVELQRLAVIVDRLERSGEEDANVVLAVRLLVLTGARLNEILKLQWDEVFLDHAQLRLRDSKTGRKTIYLSKQAITLLAAHDKVRGNPFVIRGRNDGAHLINLEKPWRRIRKEAGLAGVRLHDLRHTFASIGLGQGLSLPAIGALLGHRSVATTQRYAHLANEAAQRAIQTTGLALAESFTCPTPS
jgi:integrase